MRLLGALVILVAACSEPVAERATPTVAATVAPTPSPTPGRPSWLGTRPLALLPDGTAAAQPTPPELDPRVLPTIDVLPPPVDGFAFTVASLTEEVVARSTWTADCPVRRDDLRYVTVSFWGFDDKPHTGEMIVHRTVASELVGVFRKLFDGRFPIEDLRVTTLAERDAAPTGDGNSSDALVCRPTVGSTSWSQHAYGRAIDINPFQNPYVKGKRILPELATSYADRSNHRPGMILPKSPVVKAFAEIGWKWGGNFRSLKDTMHFSQNGL